MSLIKVMGCMLPSIARHSEQCWMGAIFLGDLKPPSDQEMSPRLRISTRWHAHLRGRVLGARTHFKLWVLPLRVLPSHRSRRYPYPLVCRGAARLPLEQSQSTWFEMLFRQSISFTKRTGDVVEARSGR